MFILLVQVEVRPELLDEWRRAIAENARLSVEREPDCHRFEVSAVAGTGNRFVFYEVYTSEAAWLAHRETAHFLAYKQVGDRALLSREITKLEPLTS
jgi:autoinducer 2-degrading protein